MPSSIIPDRNLPSHNLDTALEGPEREAVLGELECILQSSFFRTSKRSKQFLAYVVQHVVDGNQEPLKERTIGTKLFDRPAGYSTGDDPVVRVLAGEVRRRLEQYHHAALNVSPVRIELPVGSYAPEFRWTVAPPVVAAVPIPVLPIPVVRPSDEPAHLPAKGHTRTVVWASALGFVVALLLVLLGFTLYRSSARNSALSQFWSPVFGNSEPVLICLAKPTVYLPSRELLRRHAVTPDAPQSELQRLTETPHLQPQDKLVWSDMVKYPDYGVAAGDVYAAVRLSTSLGRMGKESQVRIGTNYSFTDLRNAPAIVVGAFNNRWTMQMTSNLHFAFVEENGITMIREQGPHPQTWRPKLDERAVATEDYGIVTRLLNSKTGQFVVSTAGIMADGTQAASEFVSTARYLEEASRTLPEDWPKKNLQFVVHTTVTDAVPGPPQVVAVYVW